MDMTIIRLFFACFVLALAVAVYMVAGSPTRKTGDPALPLLRIPLSPELALVVMETLFLAYQAAGIAPPFFLAPIADAAQIGLGFAYVLFTYRSWQVNGLSLAGYPQLAWFGLVTVINIVLLATRYVVPGFESAGRSVNAVLLGSVLLYAGFCAVIGRGKKRDFYPSTKGGFWMAFFCLAYFPFVGVFSLIGSSTGDINQVNIFEPGRPIALQAFPLRELIVLGIYALHLEPLYSRFWGKPAPTEIPLSLRETEIAALVRQGLTNPEIAARLNLSLATVKSHVRNVLRKSGASSRSELNASQGDASQ